jgi:acetyltransferase-like isoleucine patch superfamily enzyme
MSHPVRRIIGGAASAVPCNAVRILLYRLAGVSLGRGVRISKGAKLSEGVRIGDFAKIGPCVVLGPGVTIGAGAQIRAGSHIGEGCEIGKGVVISDFALVGNAVIGEGSFVERNVVMTGFQKGRISIGRHCYIGVGGILDWSGGLEIGDYVQIAGPSIGIWTHTSMTGALKGKEMGDRSEHVVGAVKIGSRVWIGGNSTIYPGTEIESFAVVLSNSVVNAVVKTGTVVGGAPAVLKKKLKEEDGRVTFSDI